jgi:predicted amino acid dehydrogenase
MARRARRVILIGRRPDALREVETEVMQGAKPGVEVQTETRIEALKEAEVVITVTSAVDTIIGPQHLKKGAVVCDVSRPRDVSHRVIEERKDVLVIEGGMVEVPGEVDFGFNFGFPPGLAYACMAETMTLALEGRFEPFTLGKKIELAKVEEMSALAARHGFKLNGFRSFERPVTDEYIAEVKKNAGLS